MFRTILCASLLSAVVSQGAAAQQKIVTVIVNDPSNPFWFAEGEAAKRQAQSLGYRVHVYAHSGDLKTEAQLMSRAIAHQSSAILLDPASSEKSLSSIRAVKDAEIPVFILNSRVKEGISQGQFVSDNLACARNSAMNFARFMGQKGRYIILHGPGSDLNSKLRRSGFEEVLQGYPELQPVASVVASWKRDVAFELVTGLVASGVKFEGILAANDEMALGAFDAVRNESWAAGIAIGGFDGSPEAVRAVAESKLSYTVLQPIVEISRKATIQMDSLIRSGKTLASAEVQSFPCDIITVQNAPLALQSGFELQTQ
ncbi:D-ribose-binding periplasmic protein precursor [Aquimixticola soesokkakensis]|uniref:D-ribose-binding periplasmic protein n=1 Tax=Aquimixticola soesokkakensis TaxID=1519096 RepID=A0A1Y5TQW9_9RHOB|nr:D-ribose ABC transporter substrate-binding protein [Aquimixticola soesokkakensis]SLN69442.1 D-ribose-binding periplasmic protein precursor [Aquimixticola soesokkakensis]